MSLKTSYIMFSVACTLCASSVVYHSAAFAACAVLSLFGGMIQEGIEKKLLAMKDIKLIVPKELQDKVNDLVTRVGSIEYGIKSRGF